MKKFFLSINIMKLLISIFFTLFFLSSPVYSEVFNQCKSNDAPRTELDHFCPRLEGMHPKGCCPPLFKEPPLKCSYGEISRTQPKLVNSSYTICKKNSPDVKGVNVKIECCKNEPINCYKNRIDLDFIPRLIYRSENCCYENCPTNDYWRKDPQVGNLTKNHELITTEKLCNISQAIQSCSVGTSESCEKNDPCPIDPIDPPVDKCNNACSSNEVCNSSTRTCEPVCVGSQCGGGGGPICGDGKCDQGESCAKDCHICGDGKCDKGESCTNDCQVITPKL